MQCPHTVNIKKYLEGIPGKEWTSVATHTLGWGGKLDPGKPVAGQLVSCHPVRPQFPNITLPRSPLHPPAWKNPNR